MQASETHITFHFIASLPRISRCTNPWHTESPRQCTREREKKKSMRYWFDEHLDEQPANVCGCTRCTCIWKFGTRQTNICEFITTLRHTTPRDYSLFPDPFEASAMSLYIQNVPLFLEDIQSFSDIKLLLWPWKARKSQFFIEKRLFIVFSTVAHIFILFSHIFSS